MICRGQDDLHDPSLGGFGYYYDRERQAFYTEESVDGSETVNGVTVQLRYVVNCPGNTTDNPVGVGECTTSPCLLGSGEQGINFLVYQRMGSAPWQLRPGLVCRVVSDPIPLADVEAEIRRIIEERFKHVAEPVITVAPAVNALVNLPVIASTADYGPLGFDITNPLPGRVEASPSYTWAWSNGDTNTGAGVGYDGTSPTRNPGHYPVQSTFAGGGAESVDLQVAWSISSDRRARPDHRHRAAWCTRRSEGFAVRSARTVLVGVNVTRWTAERRGRLASLVDVADDEEHRAQDRHHVGDQACRAAARCSTWMLLNDAERSFSRHGVFSPCETR